MSHYELPGAKFAAYLKQQNDKWARAQEQKFIFNDIEKHEQQTAPATEAMNEAITEEAKVIGALIRTVKELLISWANPIPEKIAYRGKIDCLIPRNYPAPAKSGHFWVIETPGMVGDWAVNPGDVLVRVFYDWLVLRQDDVNAGMMKRCQPGWVETSPSFSDSSIKLKSFTILKPGITTKPKQEPKPPATKAAPGPGKRKVILEDE